MLAPKGIPPADDGHPPHPLPAPDHQRPHPGFTATRASLPENKKGTPGAYTSRISLTPSTSLRSCSVSRFVTSRSASAKVQNMNGALS